MNLKPLIFALLLIMNNATAQICFAPKAAYEAGINPASLCCSDFNGDHIIDLAVANKAGTVSVLIGNGSGGFGSASDFTTGYMPIAICAADFNGDSIYDLATANAGPWTISMLPGTGTGSFGTDTIIGGAANPHAMTTADFNKDGHADIALATQYTVMILLGDGAGNFIDSSFATGHSYSGIVSADFNEDSILDLAMSGSGNKVYVLFGAGNGSFGLPATFAVDTSPLSIVAADFNSDGKMDLATCNMKNNITGNLSMIVGDGTGNFATAVNFPIGLNIVPQSMCSADFNGDHIPDLAISAVAMNSTPQISVLQGNGNGTFGTPASFEVDSFPHTLVSADFNRDGKMDLAIVTVLTNNDTGKVDILLNCTTTGLSQLLDRDNRIEFYPNPGNGVFHMAMNTKKPDFYIIEIFNVFGELIYSSVSNGLSPYPEIDLGSEAPGIYFAQALGSNKMYTGKIIKTQNRFE